jgi:solute carrier family 25 carnitine/acylcarnitine transporter 20/29
LCTQSNAELPAYAVLSSAALGGIAYWLAIFPVDVIKSSMQTDSIIKSQRRYTDMVSAAKVKLAYWLMHNGRGFTAGVCREWGISSGLRGGYLETWPRQQC